MKMSGEKKEERWKTRVPVKVPLTEINAHLKCPVCFGYLIDATAIVECQHTFCKSCILKYLEEEENLSCCPLCEVLLNERDPRESLRSDEILQKLVYKLVPGLVASETQRRKEFEANLPSSSENPETEVEVVKEAEELCFLSPVDPVILSLEYFKSEEEDGEDSGKGKADATQSKTKQEVPEMKTNEKDKANDRRFLQCPAAVSVGILKKFIRQKYGLSDDYRVDLLYNGDPENNLENELTLLDLSFIFKWKKAEPMCFHYRIFDRPLKTILGRPGIKRTAPSVLDEPPPDDAPPSTGPQNHPSTSSSTPSSKQPRLGGGTGAASSGDGVPPPSDGKNSTRDQTSSVTPLQVKGQGGPALNKNVTLRGRSSTSTSRGDETEFSSSPGYSEESLSPTAKNSGEKSSTDQVTTSSSSPESPSSPLKISIKSDGKHGHHRHRHRHHKEKHKRRKSKSKSKSKDRDKERYKYNAHPNPTQSQTISVKPGKHHHHHHHHKNRDKETGSGSSTGVEKGSSANVQTSNSAGTGTTTKIQQLRQRPPTTGPLNQGILERRASSSGIELKPIPIPPTKPPLTPTANAPQQARFGKPALAGMKIPDSLQLQVPKSVTLIPVTPGSGTKTSNLPSRGIEKGTGLGRQNPQTFTHPITNKSLHQITVTEVPPPSSKSSNASSTVGSSSSNNVITIEKCSPNPSSLSTTSKQLFNGPGSMEITKIYCDTTHASSSSPASGKSKTGVFDAHSQGKKLKGLDISITPSPAAHKSTPPRHKAEESTNTGFAGKLAGIPKIPGVSILPQAVHNANKEQQRKFSSGMMSLSCTKINENNGQVKVNSGVGSRLLSVAQQQKHSGEGVLRSASPADTVNGKPASRTPPRKSSGESVGSYENSRVPSPSQLNRKFSGNSSTVLSNLTQQNEVQRPKSRDILVSSSGKGTKRSIESSSPISNNLKKPRGEPPQQVQEKKKPEHESLPLDLSGGSRRLSPPAELAGQNNHPPTHQSQSSPKLSHNKTQSTPSIDSIVENLTQKQQKGSVRSSASSSSSKESISPPSHSVPSPPSVPMTGYHHADLLTLSNAAASARKMNQLHKQPQSGTAMSNLLAAANAMAYNCPQQGTMGPPPNAPQASPGSTTLMLPGLLQQFSHHQLSAMSQMLSPPGSGAMKSSLMPGVGGLYAGFPGLNGRMPNFGSVPPPGSALSPPFYNNRVPSLPSSNSTLKIPNLNNTKSRSRSPTSVPLPSTSSASSISKCSKSSKSNGTSPPHVTSPPQKGKPTPPAGTPSFSFGISNFLMKESSSGKGGVDPNAKAIVTSSSMGQQKEIKSAPKLPKVETKRKSENVPKMGQSPPREQSLPVSKLLGSPPEPHGAEEHGSPPQVENKCSGSRLGDLGLALGLVPCDPPTISLTSATSTASTTTTPAAGTKSFAIPSLLPSSPPTTQQQNQAVRQIPNPSLLSSRQNSCNNNNSGVSSNSSSSSSAETRLRKSNGNESVMHKGDSPVTHPTRSASVTMKTPQPQSIELNMKLWIDRYENESLRAKKESPSTSASPKDTATKVMGDEGPKSLKEAEKVISPSATFSASVPSPPIKSEENPVKSQSKIDENQAGKDPVSQEKSPLPNGADLLDGKEGNADLLPGSTKPLLTDVKTEVLDSCEEESARMEIGGRDTDLKVSSDVEMPHAASDEVEKPVVEKCDSENPFGEDLNGDHQPQPSEPESERAEEGERKESFETESSGRAEPVNSMETESVDDQPIVIENDGDLANEEMNESHSNSRHVGEISVENFPDYVVGEDSGVGDDNDSPALVIDEDEEDVTGKQEGAGDNEGVETGGQEEPQPPIQILNGNEGAQDQIPENKEQNGAQSPSEGIEAEMEGIGEEVLPRIPTLKDESERALLDAPTLPIGSEEDTSSQAEGAMKGLELGKVAAGLLVSAAAINNNNHISRETESPVEREMGSAPPINPPPANPTPPPPTVTNV